MFYRFNLLDFQYYFNKWNTVEAFPLYDESQMSLFHRKVAKRCVICVTIHRRFQIQWNKQKRIYEIKWTTPTTHTHNYGLLKNIRAEKYRADIRDLILFLFSFFTSRRMYSAISTDGHSRHTHKKKPECNSLLGKKANTQYDLVAIFAYANCFRFIQFLFG